MSTPISPIFKRSIGLDVHRDMIYITVLAVLEGTVQQYEISTNEKEFEAFLGTLGPEDQVALEATRGSRQYVKRLQTRVGAVKVANPVKLRTLTGTTAKSDRNDSLSLAVMLAVGTLPTVWHADDETQQDREILRYRHDIIQEQTRIKNRIRARLAEHGLSWQGSDVTSQDARRFLFKLRCRLPWAAQEVLTCQLEQLEQLEARLARVEDVVQVRAAQRPEVALLMTIRGLHVILALTIVASIGSIERFATPGSLANYAGLVPRQRASAGRSQQGRITKAGSRELRWALTEAVQQLCQQDGPCRNLCRRLERKKNKGIAMTACARKLAKAIWHMLTRNETFRFADPELVERKVRRREQRLTAARQRLARDQNRHQKTLVGQLALVQELARNGATIPLPQPLQATFNKTCPSAPPVKAAAAR
ncbi:MAG: IS110 family transposase [Armatimonadetes bacterium]|nr:IS110 family transposase [Armatimonadota bacterium]